jgi:hypothetical protein
MGQDFNSLNLDPLLATQIIRLLGMREYEINIPQRYNQLRDIVTYLQHSSNPRAEVLKVLSKSYGGDRLDTVWTYIELQKEKDNKIKQLDPKDFEPDIEAELKQGILTKEKVKRVKSDIEIRKQQLKKEQQEQAAHDKKVNQAVGKVFDETKLAHVQDTIYDIEQLNKELDYYG